MLAGFRPPFFSHPVLGVIFGKILNVGSSSSDGVGVALKQLGDILDSTVSQFFRFDSGITPVIFLGKRVVQSFHILFDGFRVSLHG